MVIEHDYCLNMLQFFRQLLIMLTVITWAFSPVNQIVIQLKRGNERSEEKTK